MSKLTSFKHYISYVPQSFKRTVVVTGLAGVVFVTAPQLNAGVGVMDDPIYLAMNPQNGTSALIREDELPTFTKKGYGSTQKIGLVSNEPGVGLTPIYRVYREKTKDYVMTPWANERDGAIKNYGYDSHEIAFYARLKDDGPTEPFVRYRKGAIHRNVVSAQDQRSLLSSGWLREGITFYAMPLAASATSPPQAPATPAPAPASPQSTPTQEGDGDGKFAFAIMPDTQQEAMTFSGDQFQERTKWIASQVGSRDIRFIGHTGDIVSAGGNVTDTQQHYQFGIASTAFLTIDQTNVPYLLSPGNHDTAAVCGGGSACPGQSARVNIRNTDIFNQYFSTSRLKLTHAQEFEANKIDNSYKTFTAEGTKWLVIAFEMNPRPVAVEWAKGVVAAHPNHNVAITSHYILNGDGSISTSNAGYGDTSGRYLYDNLVLKYPNIKLVFSGHVGQAGSRIDTGVNGNKVAGFVGAFHQSDFNPTRILTVDVKNDSVKSDIYAATVRDAYKAKYPDATVPNYDSYDVTYAGMAFIK